MMVDVSCFLKTKLTEHNSFRNRCVKVILLFRADGQDKGESKERFWLMLVICYITYF